MFVVFVPQKVGMQLTLTLAILLRYLLVEKNKNLFVSFFVDGVMSVINNARVVKTK